MNFQVTFHLDGRGVYYDPFEPPHLDDILHSVMIMLHGMTTQLQRDEEPDQVGMPLCQTTVAGHRIWNGSALFPEGPSFETLEYFRKKYPVDRLDLTDEASVNLQNGVYREYNTPLPLLCASRLIAYASGNRKEVKRLLKKHVQAIGKYRAKGKGRVVDITCEETPENWSLVKQGKAMRWLPDPHGFRQVRVQPPYWNQTHTITCREIGDPYTLKGDS